MPGEITSQPIPPGPVGIPYTPEDAERLVLAYGNIMIQTMPDGEQRILIPPDWTGEALT